MKLTAACHGEVDLDPSIDDDSDLMEREQTAVRGRLAAGDTRCDRATIDRGRRGRPVVAACAQRDWF